MKRRIIPVLIGLVMLGVLTLITFWLFQNKEIKPVESAQAMTAPAATSTPIQSASTQLNAAKPVNLPDGEAQKKFDELYMTPIRFFGKVVDESGKPIEDVHVKIMVADVPMSSGKRFDLTTDAKGLFALTDAHGAAVVVDVAKKGYASLEKSTRMFRLGKLQSAGDPQIPTSENPAVFVLQSVPKGQSLVAVKTFVRVPRNGDAVEVDLSTGRQVAVGQGNFRVECRTNEEAKDSEGHYDWHCKISVPNGGLIERKDTSMFEAPIEGYKETDEINMPQNAKNWSSRAQRQYFLKLGSGQYARVQFEMVAAGDHFFSIKSYVNPNSASRNLVFSSTNGN